MIMTELCYANEYIGNTSRLVLTPLTDRCYRTLMTAMKANLGGAPEGPAGTGKTETVKDLSKAVGVKVLVFNCSEGVDHRSMAKMFKGLASTGAWSCFDEFNRIEPEVLSVVAQQVLAMQVAKGAGVALFEFDGSVVPLKSMCNVFVTMNPGYVGRTELPDNLKSLFRPVAMMVPDYAMIAEIKLYSSGFLNARKVSRKVVAALRLCSQQLSSQTHYDYGMRAVISVLTAASRLKQDSPHEEEDAQILRALRSANLPKLLGDDLKLFEWIAADLFPNSRPPSARERHCVFLPCVRAALDCLNLQPSEKLIEKVLQLYETIENRHGLMIVGETLTGKSTLYKVLAESINLGCKRNELNEVPVEYFVINPKAVPLNQLYGSLDRISQEWNEGVLARVFRECALQEATGEMRRWIVLDGPVDTLWIESLNTVLDDNKMLCLANGDIIPMPDKMNMIFEAADLSKASPATISRCGMVYAQSDVLHWKHLLASWLKSVGGVLGSRGAARLEALFEGLVSCTCEFVRRECARYVKMTETHKAVSLMKMLRALLMEKETLSKLQDPKVREEDVIGQVDICFFYSLVWTVCSNTDSQGCKKVSEYLRSITSSGKDKQFRVSRSAQLPESTLPLHAYSIHNSRWRLWREQLENLDRQVLKHSTLRFHEVVVPTTDTLKFASLLHFAANNQIPALVVGPTGTGKSLYTRSFIKSLEPDHFATLLLVFSANLQVGQVQDSVEGRLETRRRGVFAPRYPKKLAVLVDDLNMPVAEPCGAQPPIELLRQFLDTGGWYSKDKKRRMRQIEDVVLVGAMTPEGGGRGEVSERFTRHFQVLAFNNFDDATVKRIFTLLMKWHVEENRLGKELVKPLATIVDASVDVYNFVKTHLLHTPEKFHYLFNMRDIARIVQGVQMAKLKDFTRRKPVRLFLHEVSRVFLDRLTTVQDRKLLFAALHKIVREQFHEDLKLVLGEIAPSDCKYDLNKEYEGLKYVVYTDVMSEAVAAYDRAYVEVSSMKQLVEEVNGYLSEYNSAAKVPVNLVLFESAIEHLLRICRVLKMAKGNLLLIGLEGSGRQSLTRFASFISAFETCAVEMPRGYGKEAWHDDVKTILRSAGVEERRAVFMLRDAQLQCEFVMEEINNLLNSGDVPHLWASEEKLEIAERLKGKVERRMSLSGENLHGCFVDRVSYNLRIVMMMSPVGETLRKRMRIFPSLVNCCSIDWFDQWPESGLNAVADKLLRNSTLIDTELSRVVKACANMQTQMHTVSDTFLKQEKRRNYVTPTMYIDFIQTYKELLQHQHDSIMRAQASYNKGIEKLQFAKQEVQAKQGELEEKSPHLEDMNKKVAGLIARIDAQIREVVEPKRQLVADEELLAARQAQEAEQLLADCNQELAKFTPKLKKAQNKMNALTAKEINELKTYKDPPKLVKLVLEAVAILREAPIVYVSKECNPKEKEASMWATAKKLLAQQNFLSGFNTFDYNSIKPEVMEKVRERYLVDLNPVRLKDVSEAAHALCIWIRAVEEYDRAYRVVRPKALKAKQAKEAYKKKAAELKSIREELQVLINTLENMQRDLAEKENRKAALEAEIESCKAKIVRARTLIEGLGDEKTRWEDSIVELQKAHANIVGDTLIASGIIVYLGGFPASHRAQVTSSWLSQCKQMSIKISSGFSLEQSFGHPIEVHEWMLNGLPTDSFSKENAVIATQSRKWPLMIDPEGQANVWIKSQWKSISSVKLTDSYLQVFKRCIAFGNPLLLEDVGTEIDPALNSVLLKQSFKQSGVPSIKLADEVVDYSSDFKLFITTKIRNPHFLPELSTKVTVIDFALTQEGLKYQLLNLIVQKEQQELDARLSQLIRQNFEYTKELKRREDKILLVLRSIQGDILDSEEAIKAVRESQAVAAQVKEKQLVALETEGSLENAREEYSPIAKYVAGLYFTVASLGKLNAMYHYSLKWYLTLLSQAIDTAETSESMEGRQENLKAQFLKQLNESVLESLFEKDKLLFSFLLAICVEDNSGRVGKEDYQFLISHPQVDQSQTNPVREWLPDSSWNSIAYLSSSSTGSLSKLASAINEKPEEWKKFYEALTSTNSVKSDISVPYAVSPIKKLCLMKAFSPGSFVAGVKDFVNCAIGPGFLRYPSFDLEKAFASAQLSTPLIFLLPGTDPMAVLRAFAHTKGKLASLKSVSLGQDQGPLAISLIKEAKKSGSWVMLQNCHLAPSFMSSLEKINDSLQTKSSFVHPSFRLWLTTYPTDCFPVSVLQGSMKLTNEAPKNVKGSVMASFKAYPLGDPEVFNSSCPAFKRLSLALCFFHSVILERHSFGALGWNTPYEHSYSDLLATAGQIRNLLESKADTGQILDALRYLVSECSYGGRVTDGKDRLLLKTLAASFFKNELLRDECVLAGLKLPPAEASYEDYCLFVSSEITEELSAEFCSLHSNAFITRNIKDCNSLLASMQRIGMSHMQVKGCPPIAVSEHQVYRDKRQDAVRDLLGRVPESLFNMEDVGKRYPPLYANSMNTVLAQELTRFNLLLQIIQTSLLKMASALNGEELMSAETEEALNSIMAGKVSELWLAKSYPSLKPLSGYIADLKARYIFFKDWVETGPPMVYWIAGLFFPQSFLTAVLQNYARKNKIEIDALQFDFAFFEQDSTDHTKKPLQLKPPDDGVYIAGLYLEGCRWDSEAKMLAESAPKVLFSKAPVIWLKPASKVKQHEERYSCPVYKTAERKGTPDSTGHSINYIMDVQMPTRERCEHWIKRGAAMICQLSE